MDLQLATPDTCVDYKIHVVLANREQLEETIDERVLDGYEQAFCLCIAELLQNKINTEE